MKKVFVVLLSLLATNAILAQDTVRYPDHWYGYTPREALMEYIGSEPAVTADGPNERGIHTVYRDCYNAFVRFGTMPEKVLSLMRPVESGANQRMYGIAVTMNIDSAALDTLCGKLVVYQGVGMVPEPSSVFPGMNRPHVYLGSVDSIMSIQFNDPPLMKKCVFEYDYSLPTVWSLYSDCYEFYFDEPVDLSTYSNTYIGITDCGFHHDSLKLGRDTSRSQTWYMASNSNDPEFGMRFTNLLYNSMMLLPEGKYKDYYERPGYENKYWQDSYWGMIFPILSPRCTAPRCLHMVPGGEWQDTAVWCGDPESEVFQLSLVGYPASPDSGTIVTVTDTSYLLPRELPDSVCVAYVRKMCTFEFATHTDTVWGDWSAPILVAGDTTGLGIDTTGTGGDSLSIARTDLLQGITLTPNPAGGTVTVRSAERMTEIEVLDIVGNKMMVQKASGLTAKLDVATLPRGTYIVRIHTPMGIASRKLLLQ